MERPARENLGLGNPEDVIALSASVADPTPHRKLELACGRGVP